MKTIIFNGSPRKNGDTVSLISELKKQLTGEVTVVDCYYAPISPCMDCRYCMSHPGCAIKDGMQELYGKIIECDRIIIASPIYFSELPGKLLDVASRLQMFFCARFFQKIQIITKEKKGAVILVGGGDGSKEKAFSTACTLLHQMNAKEIHPLVFSHNTNEIPAIKDAEARKGIQSIIDFFEK